MEYHVHIREKTRKNDTKTQLHRNTEGGGEMSEKAQAALETICRCFDEMTEDEQQYFIGFADGLSLGRDNRSDKARAEMPAADASKEE